MKRSLWFNGLLPIALSTTAIASAGAQPRQAVPSDGDVTSLLVDKQSRDHYRHLFQGRSRALSPFGTDKQMASEELERVRPDLKCQILVIPVDPRVDPRIFLRAPETDTKYTMRLLEPPCTAGEQR